MQRGKLIHFDLSLGSYSSFITRIVGLAKKKSSYYVCVANVHMFVEAYRDKGFCNVIHDADIITPDGMPLTWGMRLLYGIQQDRVAGSDILPDLLQQCEASGLSVFFYGSSKNYWMGLPIF